MKRRLVVSTILALGMAVPALVAQSAPPQQKTPPQKNPLLKLSEPWPEDDALAKLKSEADGRKLFQDASVLEFTLTSDFSALNKERTPNNGKLFPGELTLGTTTIPVKLSSRGHLRLKKETCEFVPIKVEFPADQIAGTIFEGQTSLKLGTHCMNERASDQLVIREYLANRLATLVLPSGFRTRLARATYVDAKSKKTVSTHAAMFLEHENDVARRLGGRDVVLHLEFKSLEPDTLTTMSLIEYMLGNTDYSIWALHNVIIVQNKRRTLFPIPYDFDSSGLVSPPYAAPDARLRLSSVKDRLYRGPCRTVEEFNAAAETFRARKADMLAAIESVTDLTGPNKGDMKDYLESFFKSIATPEAVKKTFVDGCHTQRTRI